MKKIFKYTVTIILVFFLFKENYSQPRNNDFPKNERKGKLSGIVVDYNTNSPIEGATILIYNFNDTVKIGGTQTDKSGVFTIELFYGKYRAEANEIGYSTALVDGININSKKPDVLLDTIRIKQGTTTTDEIDVTAEKNLIEITPEKKVFNVEKSIVSSNGSATDILKNVPSVSVDNDGNVSMKGSQNVRVMIDGRPVYSSIASVLDGIPASSVESIELVTNPSAKYEAEGESGIINIVLKKNTDVGYNGTLMLSTGTKDKYNASATMNIKKNKLNIYGNYSFQSFSMGISGTSLRLNDINNVISTLDQPSTGSFKNVSNLGKFGIDYAISDKQTIGFNTTLSYRKRSRPDIENNALYDASGIQSLYSITNSLSSENGYNFDAGADYKKKYKQKEHELSVQASFSRSYEGTPITENNHYLVVNYLPSNIPDGQLSTNQTEKRNTLNLQADYSHPFGKNSKIETGLKSTYKLYDNTFFSQHVDTITNTWVTDYGLNNTFKYTEFINALYAAYSNKIGNFEFQAGIRTEMTATKGELSDASQNFTFNYIDFFPSASLTQKLGKQDELQLTYSRRLNRPRPGWLNPFGENTDPYNLRTGNPQLKPEYIDSYEFSFLKYIPGALVTSSVYFRETHGLISRIKSSVDSVTTLTSWVNLSKAYTYGFELIANVQKPKWLNVTGSFSYYNTQITGDNIQSELSNSGNAWYTKLLATINLWFGFDLQAAYNYQSKTPTIDGYFEPFQSLDLSLRREIIKKRFDMSMRVSDVLNTQAHKQYQSGDGYSQNVTFRRDSRVAYLTVTYRFGNVNDEQKRDKNRKPKDDNSPDIDN